MTTDASADRWGFPPWFPAIGGALAAVGIVLLLLAGSDRDHLVGGVTVAIGLAVVAVGIRLRTRLIASPSGLTIRRLLSTQLLPWAQIEKIGTVAHRRWGSRSELLELELSDDGYLVFGGTELGSRPDEVARSLRRWKLG